MEKFKQKVSWFRQFKHKHVIFGTLLLLLIFAGLNSFTTIDTSSWSGGTVTNLQVGQHMCDSPELVLNRWINRANDKMSFLLSSNKITGASRKQLPTKENPFIFFHARKAGGSTIRKFLKIASDDLNISAFIPCFTSICHHWTIPYNEQNKSIYAGHFKFVDALNIFSFQKLPRSPVNVLRYSRELEEDDDEKEQQHNQKQHHETNHHNWKYGRQAKTNFDCIVSLRSTISRVISCWNYRFRGRTVKLASNMTSDDWKHNLTKHYSKYKFGCNNEYLRVFGNLAEEELINTFNARNHTFVDDMKNDDFLFDTCIASMELNRILSRLSQCIVVLQDYDRCQDNNRIVEHYIPWLAPYFDTCGSIENRGVHTSSDGLTLQPGSEEVIMQFNQMDEYVYQFGKKLFEQQLAQITT